MDADVRVGAPARRTRTALVVACAVALSLVIVVWATRPEVRPAGASPAATPGDAVEWPLTVRYVERTAEAGRLIEQATYQFTGSSWNDWVVTTLRIEDESGLSALVHTGHTVRFSRGVVQMGYLDVAPETLGDRSVAEVSALQRGFPADGRVAGVGTVPPGDQAPSPLFNVNWAKDWDHPAEGEVEPLLRALPTWPPAGAIGPPDTTFAVVHRSALVPRYAETAYRGVRQSLAVVELVALDRAGAAAVLGSTRPGAARG